MSEQNRSDIFFLVFMGVQSWIQKTTALYSVATDVMVKDSCFSSPEKQWNANTIQKEWCIGFRRYS
jgi:hypothetical protein